MTFEPILVWAVILFTVTAALIDVYQRRIPNWLTVSTILLGLSYYGLTSGWAGLWFSFKGCATGFAILLVLWLVGGGGGGDVKLMAAIGALFGAQLTVVVFFASTMLALSGVLLLATVNLISGAKKTAGDDTQRGRVIPYALPAAGATWAVLAWQIVVH